MRSSDPGFMASLEQSLQHVRAAAKDKLSHLQSEVEAFATEVSFARSRLREMQPPAPAPQPPAPAPQPQLPATPNSTEQDVADEEPSRSPSPPPVGEESLEPAQGKGPPPKGSSKVEPAQGKGPPPKGSSKVEPAQGKGPPPKGAGKAAKGPPLVKGAPKGASIPPPAKGPGKGDSAAAATLVAPAALDRPPSFRSAGRTAQSSGASGIYEVEGPSEMVARERLGMLMHDVELESLKLLEEFNQAQHASADVQAYFSGSRASADVQPASNGATTLRGKFSSPAAKRVPAEQFFGYISGFLDLLRVSWLEVEKQPARWRHFHAAAEHHHPPLTRPGKRKDTGKAALGWARALSGESPAPPSSTADATDASSGSASLHSSGSPPSTPCGTPRPRPPERQGSQSSLLCGSPLPRSREQTEESLPPTIPRLNLPEPVPKLPLSWGLEAGASSTDPVPPLVQQLRPKTKLEASQLSGASPSSAPLAKKVPQGNNNILGRVSSSPGLVTQTSLPQGQSQRPCIPRLALSGTSQGHSPAVSSTASPSKPLTMVPSPCTMSCSSDSGVDTRSPLQAEKAEKAAAAPRSLQSLLTPRESPRPHRSQPVGPPVSTGFGGAAAAAGYRRAVAGGENSSMEPGDGWAASAGSKEASTPRCDREALEGSDLGSPHLSTARRFSPKGSAAEAAPEAGSISHRSARLAEYHAMHDGNSDDGAPEVHVMNDSDSSSCETDTDIDTSADEFEEVEEEDAQTKSSVGEPPQKGELWTACQTAL
ncbi:unnamed protein product [Polarella glacialis]|uniref:Uncharacterized protein n=1 Tax=Polarella glacialis TaxID=89957 RepID=A0A813LYF4_POLGL|nr:unnamed protein product [Polarella glacialis]